MTKPSLSISIVSHGQGELIRPLLKDFLLADFTAFEDVLLIITLNIEEDDLFLLEPPIRTIVIRNLWPMGFGANHNQAFGVSDADYFVVINPDIRLVDFSFSRLITENKAIDGVCSPAVRSPSGFFEDSARRYPSVSRILKRVLLRRRELDYSEDNSGCIQVDWVAGMFMLFKSQTFRRFGGFDTRYFMYLEDADICRRLNHSGFKVLYDLRQYVIHDARRNSFKNHQHLKWHLRSMFRFIFGF
ncbi:glycosyltransferase family 2 protein [Gammaproteobacteria bacterium]|nr:glycosyltransferase family 2 protein [Gammaproteobacteria bacterium]